MRGTILCAPGAEACAVMHARRAMKALLPP